ncbi:unnamed protein product [Lampetra planeri]
MGVAGGDGVREYGVPSEERQQQQQPRGPRRAAVRQEEEEVLMMMPLLLLLRSTVHAGRSSSWRDTLRRLRAVSCRCVSTQHYPPAPPSTTITTTVVVTEARAGPPSLQ